LSGEVPASGAAANPAEADLSVGAVGALEQRVQGVSLETRELTAGYGGSPVVHGVSIDVQPGEVVSLVGPNGSGKSTLLKSIVGLVEVLSGTVLVGDREVTGWAPEDVARIGVGYVPQIDDVFAPLTVRENLEMGGYLLKSREVPARLERVLEVFPQLRKMVGRRAGKLSGGERKMLAMGRALMLEPALVVLDEPTANLAPIIAAQVLHEHVRQLAGTGASVLVVEQRAKAVLEISDRTYVLGGGQLRMRGTPEELASSPEFVDSFLGGSGHRS
jgi:ABC-type branched-subunit amino acid transport system ATPase component